MPLFGSKNQQPALQPAPISTTQSSTRSSGGGFFSKRRSSSVSSTDPSPVTNTSPQSHSHSIFHRNHHHDVEDPSIAAARQRVAAAEQAEREADLALNQARISVRDAREHVKSLEREAAEEARLAKIKQGQAKDISERAKPLGRFN